LYFSSHSYYQHAPIRLCGYIEESAMVSQDLAQEISQLEADFCFALSDPTRLLILYSLGGGAHNVTELASDLNLAQPTASRHLKILRDRGLVYTVRHGTTVHYHLGDERLLEALDLLRSVMRDRLTHRAELVAEAQPSTEDL
jgi:DNA-binding transcriptional ArsR family regulator